MNARTAATRLLAAAWLVAAACSGGPPAGIDPPAPPVSPGPSPRYVAVGASETVGIGADAPLREGWPRLLYREALPQATVFVNLGIPGAKVADVLGRTADHAVELAPDLVTVWLNVNDLLSGVTPADYERRLDVLVARLRRDGRTRVLVANTPPLDQLPSYLACRPDPPPGAPCRADVEPPPPETVRALVGAYNDAVDAVARRHGAEVVDLHALGLAARADGTAAGLVAADGFHPSTGGHAAVAGAFARALARGGPLVPGPRE